MSNVKFVNIARMMTTYNLEIDNEMLPDNLKCIKCKLVLKDACTGLCGCRFCRVCINNLIASGSEFCPVVTEDCRESLLTDFVTDYIANLSISKLIVKCPQNGCEHECELVALDEHMRVCGRKSVACPFHELGCQQDKLAADEMSGHFQQDNVSHCKILIRMIADIKMEMELHKREIEILKKNDESSKSQIEILKCELVLKDEQIRTMIDQIGVIENENKCMGNAIKSIKVEKADLADRVRILSEKIERETNERCESNERDMTNMVEHIDREITAITVLIGSNKNEMDTVMRSVKDDIRSINQDSIKTIKDDIDGVKSKLQSIQALVGLGQIDASCEWTINEDIGKKNWIGGDKMSEFFSGAVYPYKYRLSSWNMGGELEIYLRIYSGPRDPLLSWPFSGKVVITVADRTKCEARQSITMQCKIDKPGYDIYRSSEPICAKFFHLSLVETGLDLTVGVCVSCVIVL